MKQMLSCLNFTSHLKQEMMKRLKVSGYFSKTDLRNVKPQWFLPLGIITMALSHLTYSIDIVGWFSMVPFLIYLSMTRGWKSRLLFLITLTPEI